MCQDSAVRIISFVGSADIHVAVPNFFRKLIRRNDACQPRWSASDKVIILEGDFGVVQVLIMVGVPPERRVTSLAKLRAPMKESRLR